MLLHQQKDFGDVPHGKDFTDVVQQKRFLDERQL